MNARQEKIEIDRMICAPTLEEAECYPEFRHLEQQESNEWLYMCSDTNLAFVVCGAGIPLCLQRMLVFLYIYQPKEIIHYGIAGSYRRDWGIGNIIWGESEFYLDIGFGLPDGNFKHVSNSGFGKYYSTRFKLIQPDRLWLSKVPMMAGNGATVNSCTGTGNQGLERSKFGVDFETMEGAAVAQAASLFGIDCVEIRSISNYAYERNITRVNIELAFDALKSCWEKILEKKS